KTIIIDNKATFQVTGIIADPPDNTDFPFTLIAGYQDQTVSNPYFNEGNDWNEFNSATHCYLLLPDKLHPNDFEQQLIAFSHKYYGEEQPVKTRYVLQPLSELHSGVGNNYNNRLVSEKKLMVLGLIGLFLIVIASINFINLSTAQASKRFKEVAVKKISGSSRRQLIFQLMGETITVSFIAAFLGIIIAKLAFIYFENLIGYSLDLEIFKNPYSLIFLIITALGVGLISGLYPSIIISGLEPAGTRKSAFAGKNMPGSISVRRTLVIAQFAISIILIIGTLTMHQQMDYFLNKDLGFNKEAILIAKLPDNEVNKLQALKMNLLKFADVEMVSYATRSPLADWNVGNEINYPGLEKDVHSGNLKTIDEDYLELFNLKLVAGRNCDKIKDNGTAVVNRKLTNLLGFEDPNEALGKKFKYGRHEIEFTIVGVVEDFHSKSLHNHMENVILSNLSWNIKEMIVQINPATASLEGINETLENIQEEWLKVFPGNIFDYSFLDQQIAGLYEQEKRTSNLIQLFTFIAIIIGCLGLFGLISYITSLKIKEIGIRKVNGAKVSEVLAMLNKDFIKWVVIAFVVACPIAYYAMNKWLENFAYKTTLSWWIFGLAGVLALGIALLTVSFQSWKAATRNPVEALRYE
ncbi:MAG: FtsX-like permease family protein, partial [Bacteroidales bacterium]|nr:FtsX-like permease family protein [Bacteroidales bacterium]